MDSDCLSHKAEATRGRDQTNRVNLDWLMTATGGTAQGLAIANSQVLFRRKQGPRLGRSPLRTSPRVFAGLLEAAVTEGALRVGLCSRK